MPRKEQIALAEILEYAKAIRDLSNIGTANHASWCHVVDLAYRGLGEPSMAKIDEIRSGRPSKDWLERAAAAEDATSSMSVGGLLADEPLPPEILEYLENQT